MIFKFLFLLGSFATVFGDRLFPDACEDGGGASTDQEVWVEGMSEPQPYKFAPGSYPVLFKFTPDHDSSPETNLKVYLASLQKTLFDPIHVQVLGPFKAGVPSNVTFNFDVPIMAFGLDAIFYGRIVDPLGDMIMCVSGEVIV